MFKIDNTIPDVSDGHMNITIITSSDIFTIVTTGYFVATALVTKTVFIIMLPLSELLF